MGMSHDYWYLARIPKCDSCAKLLIKANHRRIIEHELHQPDHILRAKFRYPR